eukprot:GHVN01063738.1.p1 GENE.GHVN01063738.1~~GHVN01063738.1.p1  ORF type:complete len:243 (+),score=15.34 GHVN01063738.1:631-1359(+)
MQPEDTDKFQNTINIDGWNLGANIFLGKAEQSAQNINLRGGLKKYFEVTPKHVISKIFVILFPFRHQDWKRLQSDMEKQGGESTSDINAPDLYIPFVSLTTFILLKAFSSGFTGGFHPDIIALTGTYSLLILGALCLFVKVVCYVFGFGFETSFLDIAAVLGYNFVNLCVVFLAGMLSSVLRIAVTAYTVFSMSFFLARSLLHSILPMESQLLISQSRKKKINFLVGVLALNAAFSLLLTRL